MGCLCGRTCCNVCAKCILIGLSIITIVCIIGAVVAPGAIESLGLTLATDAITKIFVFTPTSELYERWVEPPVPAYQKFYFFDIQNPDDVLDGARPKVIERGPYVYRLDISRYNLSFANDSDSLSYSWYTWWTFEPEMSAGPESDTITTINVPLVSVAMGARYEDWLARLTISAIASIHQEGVFKTLTIQQLLWGYEDEVLKMLQDLAGKDMVPTYTIGILHGQNGSSLSAVVNTGTVEPMLVNELLEFNETKALTCWDAKEANMINGTDGSVFHTSITKEETLYIYSPLNFRSLPITFKRDVTISDIPMYQFSVPSYIYANATEHPPNKGFCAGGYCSPTGLLNITACTGAPLSISMPHFLYATPDIINATDGLSPNETDHGSSITIEPITGVPYVQNRRVQMNVYMEPVDGVRQTYGVPMMHYPLLWIELENTLPEYFMDEHKAGFALVPVYASYAQYLCIGLAIFSFALMVILIICLQTKCSKSRTQPREHHDGSCHVKSFSKGSPRKSNNGSRPNSNTYVSIETSGGHTVEIMEEIPLNPSIASSKDEKDALSDDDLHEEESILMAHEGEDEVSELKSVQTTLLEAKTASSDWLSEDVEDALMRSVTETTPLRSGVSVEDGGGGRLSDDDEGYGDDATHHCKTDSAADARLTLTVDLEETVPLRSDCEVISEIRRHSTSSNGSNHFSNHLGDQILPEVLSRLKTETNV